MPPPFKLKPDAALFARVAAGESLRSLAPEYGVNASNLSRFLRGAGADQLAKAREPNDPPFPPHASPERPDATETGAPIITPRQRPLLDDWLPGYLDDKAAEREARTGRAPGQPASSPLTPTEYAEHVVRVTLHEPALAAGVTDAQREHAHELEAWLAGVDQPAEPAPATSPYACPMCPEVTTSEAGLRQHIEWEHSE